MSNRHSSAAGSGGIDGSAGALLFGGVLPYNRTVARQELAVRTKNGGSRGGSPHRTRDTVRPALPADIGASTRPSDGWDCHVNPSNPATVSPRTSNDSAWLRRASAVT